MVSRRTFLRFATLSASSLAFGYLSGCAENSQPKGPVLTPIEPPQRIEPSVIDGPVSLLDELGPLLPPDENGLMLPPGFTSRIIAQSRLSPYVGSAYVWHDAPDGGATFPSSDGGWVYVSNSEIDNNLGGVGVIKFDSSGNVIDTYSILDSTSRNCGGGVTPWGTWLSCEETDKGSVWECDPSGQNKPVNWPALGLFRHESIAIDTQNNVLYMTEDKPDGCFYRFTPDSVNSDGILDLSSGTVEVAIVDFKTANVSWSKVPDPSASTQATRYQVDSSTQFDGGEGIVFHDGIIYLSTKGDNRIWSYYTSTSQIAIIYDANTHANPILKGVDNMTLTMEGELVVAEDGDDLQVVAISKTGKLVPLSQLVGHTDSEITGPAFSPDGKRLYFSSQRGKTDNDADGVTFEVTGPFHG